MSTAEARQAIEDAIAAVVKLMADSDEIATDAVLILGVQRIDDDGDRDGRVISFPRHGCQPPYITLGLIDSARNLITVEQAWGRWNS